MKKFIRRHPRLAITVGFLALLLAIGGISSAQYKRSIPELALVATPAAMEDGPPAAQLPFSPKGQSGVAIAGVGVIGETPRQESVPIASLVKIMTAHVVLEDHPLVRGEPGPQIEIQPEHVAAYRARLANGESVVPVTAGSKLTERELIRGLLLASGNNLADILAEFNSGSVEAFVQRMNEEAASLGMTKTQYHDAAGLLATSMSTAHDQILLANAAMADREFSVTVKEPQANVTGAGVVFNTNSQLGTRGIVGIKTGWTEEAGACFVFAAEQNVGDRTVMVIGAVLGQDTLNDAFARSRELIAGGGASVRLVQLGSEGQAVGQIKSRWGQTADAVLASDASLFIIPGMEIKSNLKIEDATTSVESGAAVGSIAYVAGDQTTEVPLKASSTVSTPDLQWRLTRLR